MKKVEKVKSEEMGFLEFLVKTRKLVKRYKKYLKQSRLRGTAHICSIEFDVDDYIRYAIFAKDGKELFNLYESTARKITALENIFQMNNSDKKMESFVLDVRQNLTTKTR